MPVTGGIAWQAGGGASDNPGMNVTYAGKDGASGPYEIDADRHGNYTIRLGGKVVKRVTSLTTYLDRPRWGSRKLELAAIEEAKAAIDAQQATEA